jgi:hypothetical protein
MGIWPTYINVRKVSGCKDRRAYRRNIVEEFPQEANNVVHVLVALYKTKSLAPRQVTNDIESKELQPLTEVASFSCIREHLFCPVKPVCQSRANKRFVVDERAHRKSIVDASSVLCMEVFVGGREEGQKRLAFRDCTLHGVEVGLVLSE